MDVKIWMEDLLNLHVCSQTRTRVKELEESSGTAEQGGGTRAPPRYS